MSHANNQPNDALAKTCALIEQTLGSSSAFSKIDQHLFIVRQGSAYVTISVLPAKHKSGNPLLRIYAQVAAGVRPQMALFHRLLTLNAQIRFGAFAYVDQGNLVLFVHSVVGGDHLGAQELTSIVGEMAIIADQYDDSIVAEWGGMRMQDLVEEVALAHVLGFRSALEQPGEGEKK